MSEVTSALDLLVPGSLEQRTGGYLYDARVVDGLRRLGWTVRVHELRGRFPDPDSAAISTLEAALAKVPEAVPAVIDGLALAALGARSDREPVDRTRLALVHHPLSDETGLTRELGARLEVMERRALARCAGVIVTSRFTASRVVDRLGVSEARVRVVPPGTDPDPEPPSTEEPSDDHALGQTLDGSPQLLCVGSVIPRKGQRVLVDALTELSDLDWQCTVAGSLDRDREYADEVVQRARRVGLADRIAFTGELDHDELVRLYRSSSIFVLPSFYEGYGMALAEALAFGLPVVSTTGGAIPHTVPDSAGILVPPGDVPAVRRAIGALLGDAAERRRLSNAAHRYAAGLPDWDEAASGFAAAVRDLGATRPRPEASGAR